MARHFIPSPLSVAILMTSALMPALVLAQSQAPAPSAAPTAAATPPKTASHVAKKAATAQRTPLDLHAPPLSHIYPRGQLQYIMAVDANDSDDAEEVSVKGSKYLVPVPKSQFQAIPWALLHPTEAWRVFTPIESP